MEQHLDPGNDSPSNGDRRESEEGNSVQTEGGNGIGEEALEERSSREPHLMGRRLGLSDLSHVLGVLKIITDWELLDFGGLSICAVFPPG